MRLPTRDNSIILYVHICYSRDVTALLAYLVCSERALTLCFCSFGIAHIKSECINCSTSSISVGKRKNDAYTLVLYYNSSQLTR